MKKSKFTESQILGILKEQETGKSVAEICREHGISQGSPYEAVEVIGCLCFLGQMT